jgi:hypothetical protein
MYYHSKITHCDVDKINTWTCGESCEKYPLIDVKALYNPILNV